MRCSCVVLAMLLVACSRPPAHEPTANESSGAEGETRAPAGSSSPDAWAPRNSLARIEHVPREGTVEERSSGTGQVRLVAQLPVSESGDALVSLLAVPALDPRRVIVTVRAVHDIATWADCRDVELVELVAGETRALADVEPLEGTTAFGLVEGLSARTDIDSVLWLAGADEPAIAVCDSRFDLSSSRATLEHFMARFVALVPASETSE
jgi:hypothetical protein